MDKRVELYNKLQYRTEREADTAFWFLLYDNYNDYKNNEIEFSIGKLNINVKNIETLKNNNINDIIISHNKFNITDARKKAIINSKLFKKIVSMELEKIDTIEREINTIDFLDIDSLNDYFNIFISENF